MRLSVPAVIIKFVSGGDINDLTLTSDLVAPNPAIWLGGINSLGPGGVTALKIKNNKFYISIKFTHYF